MAEEVSFENEKFLFSLKKLLKNLNKKKFENFFIC
jgi:hypothetical protein